MLKTMTVDIEGMHCGDCAAAVRRSLKTLDGVLDVEVSLEKAQATVQVDPSRWTTARNRIEAAFGELGYRAEARRPTPDGTMVWQTR